MNAPDFLRSIVDALIPDTPYSLTATRSGRMHILTLDVPNGPARGIVLGRGGETLNALRRILTAFTGSRGETVTIYFNTESKESSNVRSELAQ